FEAGQGRLRAHMVGDGLVDGHAIAPACERSVTPDERAFLQGAPGENAAHAGLVWLTRARIDRVEVDTSRDDELVAIGLERSEAGVQREVTLIGASDGPPIF